MSEFGRTLKQIREAKGMKLGRLAELTKIHNVTFKMVEKGQLALAKRDIPKICTALECNHDELSTLTKLAAG